MSIAFLSVIKGENQVPEDLDALLHRGYRYALSLTHDRAEAEDLLQDACIALARAGGKWEKSYLFATIRNRFIDKYRRDRKILFVPIEAEAEYEMESLADEGEVPDVMESEALHRALGALRAEEREALFLAFVEGYTAQQIASMTKRPRGTVLSLLHRSKQKLRRLLRNDVRETSNE